MKKPDLSKEGIANFFVNHGEKLGVALVVAISAFLAYSAFKGTSSDETRVPSDLITEANRAKKHIDVDTWDQLAPFRKAPKDVDKSVKSGIENPLKFEVKNGLSLLNKTRIPQVKRKDPKILPPLDLETRVGLFSWAMKYSDEDEPSPLDGLVYGTLSEEEDTVDDDDEDDFGSGGSGGFDSSDFGAGGPDSGSGGGQGGGATADAGPAPELIPAVQRREVPGVRVGSGGRVTPYGQPVVSVTALVPFKEQLKEFNSKFAGTLGHDPAVDYPRYAKIDVIRKEVGGDKEVNITKEIYENADYYHSTGPEIVDADFYDSRISMAIPPLLMQEFEDFVLHSKTPRRSLEEIEAGATGPAGSTGGGAGGSGSAGFSPSGSGGSGSAGFSPGGPDSGGSGGSGGFDSSKFGAGQPGGGGSSAGGSGSFDSSRFGAGGPDSSGGSSGGSRNFGAGGYAGGGGSFGGGGGAGKGGAGGAGGAGTTKRSSPFSGADVVSVKDANDFKLVRFFDFTAKAGKSYQYKVRVFLIDPNLPIEEVTGEEGGTTTKKKSNKDDKYKDDGPMAGGGGMSPGGGGMSPGGGGMSPGGGGAAGGSSIEVSHGNTLITEAMLDSKVRARLKVWRSSDRSKNEDEDLRFGRQSPWSEFSAPVTVPVDQEKFFAGTTKAPSIRAAKNVTFTEREPTAEMAFHKWGPKLEYFVPGVKTISRGSMMKFKQVVKLAHPADWTIREFRGNVIDPDKKVYEGYLFDSDSVVVDIDGGQKLDNVSGQKVDFFEPAEILVFDANGDFHLQNELDDMKEYRHTIFASEEGREAKAKFDKNSYEDDEAKGGGGGNKSGRKRGRTGRSGPGF